MLGIYKKKFKIAVLGAGYMGSAITFPLAQNGFKVNLWGTWLDDKIIEACQKGNHPKLKIPLMSGIRLFHSQDLFNAIRDVDIIFIGVSSEGFLPVFTKLLNIIKKNIYIFTLTKGFVEENGNIDRASIVAKKLFKQKLRRKGLEFHWVSIGGPVKALELAHNIPTVSVYGSTDQKILKIARSFSTKNYCVVVSNDQTGIELSATFKNIYSIAMGIIDGLYGEKMPGNYHNFSALIFNQSILEMSTIIGRAGGEKSTVFNNAGIGDLYTTSQSGRNRLFGELVGKGNHPDEVYNSLLDDGKLAEGYHTLEASMKWIMKFDSGLIPQLPLFNIIYEIVISRQKTPAHLVKILKSY
jgi:glycerol-3-phosphate dehydrogenase (NAD(P)+)